MIYDTKSPYFASFLSNSKHTPSTEEVINALADIKLKNPTLKPEAQAGALRAKYPGWVLDNLNWAELAAAAPDED